MALVRARHQVFGVCEVGEQTVAAFPDEWTLVDPQEPAATPAPDDVDEDLVDGLVVDVEPTATA